LKLSVTLLPSVLAALFFGRIIWKRKRQTDSRGVAQKPGAFTSAMEGTKIENSNNNANIDVPVDKIGQVKAIEETEVPGKVEANQIHKDV
jgi:hypothetical protein